MHALASLALILLVVVAAAVAIGVPPDYPGPHDI
jgi:hypothetical protein